MSFIHLSLNPAQQQKISAIYEKLPKPAATYAGFRQQLARVAPFIAGLCFLLSPFPFHAWRDAALLTGMVIVTSLLAVRLPHSDLTTYPGIPIFFTIVALFGASATVFAIVICVFAGGFVAMPPRDRFRLKLYVPNMAGQVIVFGVSALLYALLERLFFPLNGLRLGEHPGLLACLTLPLCTFLAFMGNALLTTTQISLYEKRRWDIIWYNNVRWQLISAVLMTPLAVITAMVYNERWWWGVCFIVVPVYAIRLAVLTHERTLAAYRQGVDLLGRIMQEAHPYTHGHLHRVARWAKEIAEEMHLPAASMAHIEDAAILHDIGKVAVDDRVLNKVGKLTEEDWAMIKRHPVTGADLVIKMSVMNKVSQWIRHHHERPDGKGYPDGLADTDIPIESCIISAVDAFDAMVGGPLKEDQRPYRQPMARDAAIAELRRHAGTQFHADVVEVFISVLEREQQLEARGQAIGPKPTSADDSLWSGPYDPTAPAYSLSH